MKSIFFLILFSAGTAFCFDINYPQYKEWTVVRDSMSFSSGTIRTELTLSKFVESGEFCRARGHIWMYQENWEHGVGIGLRIAIWNKMASTKDPCGNQTDFCITCHRCRKQKIVDKNGIKEFTWEP